MTSEPSSMPSNKNLGRGFRDISSGRTGSFGKAKLLMPNNGEDFWPG
jgi:hypothetical protein